MLGRASFVNPIFETYVDIKFQSVAIILLLTLEHLECNSYACRYVR